VNRKLAVGALTGALLLSGLLVGVSYGGPDEDAGSVIELNWNTRAEGSVVEYFLFDPSGGVCQDSDPICAQITLKDMPIFDQDGTQVGRQHIQCTVADTVAWFCSYVTKLKDGPYTDHGQVTGMAVKQPDGDVVVSITGGTGAYENAGGYAFQDDNNGRVRFTLHLTP
jgi:hypothetical protein